jgi:2-methylcitrate dehydratase
LTLAEKLAEYACSVRYSDLDQGTLDQLKLRLVDAMGCALGAASEQPVLAARGLAKSERLAAGATVLGDAFRTSPEMAAFVNGLMIRYFDFNDTYLSKEPAHPSDNFSACLAVAEAEGASGKELLAAAAVAYEVQCRLCDAASLRQKGWDHVNYGLVSTSLAAAKLMGLDEARATQAVNIALGGHLTMRQARAGELSMWKGASFANAARNGVFAARLAREGMTGPSPIFEGEMGFFRQVSGPFRVDPRAFGGRGGRFKVNETYIKYWPAEYHAQSAIWAALELRGRLKDMDQVESVIVETHEAGYNILARDKEKWKPATKETADHSLPFIVAMALLKGEIGNESYSDYNIRDKAVQKFLQRITVQEDPRLTALYPSEGMPNRITAFLKGGTEVAAEVRIPKGHPQNPMSRQDIEAKFLRLSGTALGARRAETALKRLWRVEEETNLEVLLGLLRLGRTSRNRS